MSINALSAAGTSAAAIGLDKLGQSGVLYHGLEVMGGGSILGGLVLGTVAAFIIDQQFVKAAGFALAGVALTFFGFMHGEKVGTGYSLVVAFSYVAVSGPTTELPHPNRLASSAYASATYRAGEAVTSLRL